MKIGSRPGFFFVVVVGALGGIHITSPPVMLVILADKQRYTPKSNICRRDMLRPHSVKCLRRVDQIFQLERIAAYRGLG